ncbi:MAG: glycoside hydrolase family 99-like domain-containing protein [Verrucomicrobiae bacterium]|nr:glycoside hydrolase family 99-like domain-containing protein [Verrucomicrobiae bacterium]
MRRFRIHWLTIIALALFAVVTLRAKTVVEWNFNRPDDLQGWRPNSDLTDVVITGGALHCRAVGTDPILELQPLLNFPASAFQAVEIRLQADQDGTAELFWANTSTGRYGGFTQEKALRFNVRGDSDWHTYRVLPCWQADGRIVRLRFDVYDGARFELASLRVLDLTPATPSATADFDFRQDTVGWQWLETLDSSAPPTWKDGEFKMPSNGLLLGPPVQIDTTNQSYVSLRLAVDRGERATLFFASDYKPGLHSFSFPLKVDGREHTYNLDLLSAANWRGRVSAIGLRPSDAANATVQLRWLKVSDAPQGPAQLELTSFALDEALPRVGRPATLRAVVVNTGGASASKIRADLQLPDGLKLLEPANLQSLNQPLAPGTETALLWRVEANRPLSNICQLTLSAPDADAARGQARVNFTPRPTVTATGYVPEPQPVRGPIEVGVYYFPGWNTASQWQPIQRFPERRPVLGWYREGDPEIADWHIKWAVEHGITFFAYDWYWSQGARFLEHALHDGYFKARYRRLLKFCLLWANHNPPQTSSLEDCRAVTHYWIENYFRRPEHLTFDGRPVVIIFSTDRLTADLGSAGVKRAFTAMREECQRAGLKGLYLIACVGDVGGARRAAEEGYDAVTAYNWPHLGMTGEGKFAPYAELVPAYRRQWEHLLAESPVPLTPLPISGGWDSRPWHGENNLVRFDRTPQLFQQHLRDAKAVIELQPSQPRLAPAALIEAWNEWGEGSYIEPQAEFGFGYLDAIRSVFTTASGSHTDLTPADVGLGPYDIPPPEPSRTAWEFTRDDQGWNNTMHLTEVKVADGYLRARTTGNDPAFFGPATQAKAADFSTVVVRLRLRRPDGQSFTDMAQIFWSTTRLAETESSSERFAVRGDGQWHEYRIPVGQNQRWRDHITRLRFDPGTRSNVQVELAFIRLEK